ncbi:MAG: hypothetical protein K8R68_05040 [Bacteroidales bacterium]|nr:hypothetical protein [Bacteroidales bacterium]
MEKYQKGYFVKEFHTGIGVADLVFSPDMNKRDFYFNSFELLYHTMTLFNRKNKKLKVSDIKSQFSKKNIDSLIDKFIILNLIVEYGNNSYVVRNKLSPSVSEFYSIEAKIKDWKSGFYQALRYKNFAQKSFLAISSNYIHRVNNNLLIANNIGLISVSPIETRLIVSPKKNSPKDKIAFYYSGENFTKQIDKRNEKYCPQQWL